MYLSKKTAAWIGLISNLFLTILKIVIGVLVHSQVLIADGVHNAADVVASIVAVGSIRISSLPADEDHPYGHGKAEVIASGIVGILLFMAALFISFKSIESMFEPASAAHRIGLIAALVSLLWKEILYLYTIRIGKRFNSKSLIATACDHLADVYTSLAAVAGIATAMLGEAFDIPWAKYGDPAAGIFIAVLVLKLSIGMCLEATGILMEKNVNPEKLEKYKQAAVSITNVKRVDRIRAREHGHYILVDIRVGILGTLTIQEGHDTGRKIKKEIMKVDSHVQEVLVHFNPWYEHEIE